jgi:hypothetical protein
MPALTDSDDDLRSAKDFSPADPTDGRGKGQWKTRYPDKQARRHQFWEALYLGLLLLLSGPVLLFLLWSNHLGHWLSLEPGQLEPFRTYGFAWSAGLLGGAVFTTKWLYHSVAHGFWHQDRLLWRLVTPHLSAAFAFGLVTLATSGLLDFLDAEALKTAPAMVGFAFLLGYFSDLTVARLAKTARQMLGSPEPAKPSPAAPDDRVDDELTRI